MVGTSNQSVPEMAIETGKWLKKSTANTPRKKKTDEFYPTFFSPFISHSISKIEWLRSPRSEYVPHQHQPIRTTLDFSGVQPTSPNVAPLTHPALRAAHEEQGSPRRGRLVAIVGAQQTHALVESQVLLGHWLWVVFLVGRNPNAMNLYKPLRKITIFLIVGGINLPFPVMGDKNGSVWPHVWYYLMRIWEVIFHGIRIMNYDM